MHVYCPWANTTPYTTGTDKKHMYTNLIHLSSESMWPLFNESANDRLCDPMCHNDKPKSTRLSTPTCSREHLVQRGGSC